MELPPKYQVALFFWVIVVILGLKKRGILKHFIRNLIKVALADKEISKVEIKGYLTRPFTKTFRVIVKNPPPTKSAFPVDELNSFTPTGYNFLKHKRFLNKLILYFGKELPPKIMRVSRRLFKNGKILFGWLVDEKKWLYLKPKQMFVFAQTGGGKSSLYRFIVEQVQHWTGSWKITFASTAREKIEGVKCLDLLEKEDRDYFLDLIKGIALEMKDISKPINHLIFLDEFGDFLDSARAKNDEGKECREVLQALKPLLRRGRKHGMILCVSSQSGMSEELSGFLPRGFFSYRISGLVDNEEAFINIFGKGSASYIERLKYPGLFFIMTDERFKGYFQAPIGTK